MRQLIAIFTAFCLILSSCAKQSSPVTKSELEVARIENDLFAEKQKIDLKCGRVSEITRKRAVKEITCRNTEYEEYFESIDFAYSYYADDFLEDRLDVAREYKAGEITKEEFQRKILECKFTFLDNIKTEIDRDNPQSQQPVQSTDNANTNSNTASNIVKGVAAVVIVGALVWAIVKASKNGGGGYAPNNDLQGCCSWHNGINACYGGRVLCNDGQLSPSCGC